MHPERVLSAGTWFSFSWRPMDRRSSSIQLSSVSQVKIFKSSCGIIFLTSENKLPSGRLSVRTEFGSYLSSLIRCRISVLLEFGCLTKQFSLGMTLSTKLGPIHRNWEFAEKEYLIPGGLQWVEVGNSVHFVSKAPLWFSGRSILCISSRIAWCFL